MGMLIGEGRAAGALADRAGLGIRFFIGTEKGDFEEVRFVPIRIEAAADSIGVRGGSNNGMPIKKIIGGGASAFGR